MHHNRRDCMQLQFPTTIPTRKIGHGPVRLIEQPLWCAWVSQWIDGPFFNEFNQIV